MLTRRSAASGPVCLHNHLPLPVSGGVASYSVFAATFTKRRHSYRHNRRACGVPGLRSAQPGSLLLPSRHQQHQHIAPGTRTRPFTGCRAKSRSDSSTDPPAAAGPLSVNKSWQTSVRIYWRALLRQLSSLPLALFEFAIIAALSAIGTVIDQNQTLQFYAEHYPDLPGKALGFLDYKVIWALQWDHIYTADYFLMLLATLAASLAACTTTRQWPMLKVARRWRFASTPEIAYKRGAASNAIIVPDVRLTDVGQALLSKGYQTFLQRRGSGGSLYAFKGLAGKLGPIGVHASMLAIMAGVSLGGVSGWKGTVQIPEGGDASFRQILRPVIPWAPAPKGADDLLHVNNFEVKYRTDGSVEQFVSNLSVYSPDGTKETAQKEINVNKPLRYQGITAYQTDYNMVALTVHARGSPLQPLEDQAFNLPMANLEDADEVQGKLWATFIPSQENGKDGARRGVSILAKDFQLVTLYQADGTFAGVRRIGSGTPIEVEGMRITIDGAVGATGLELKVDPGVPYVYAGFGGMMLTTLMSYMSHSQIWALEKDGRVHVGGKTNRATVEFASELTAILQSVPQCLTAADQAQGQLSDSVSEA